MGGWNTDWQVPYGMNTAAVLLCYHNNHLFIPVWWNQAISAFVSCNIISIPPYQYAAQPYHWSLLCYTMCDCSIRVTAILEYIRHNVASAHFTWLKTNKKGMWQMFCLQVFIPWIKGKDSPMKWLLHPLVSVSMITYSIYGIYTCPVHTKQCQCFK